MVAEEFKKALDILDRARTTAYLNSRVTHVRKIIESLNEELENIKTLRSSIEGNLRDIAKASDNFDDIEREYRHALAQMDATIFMHESTLMDARTLLDNMLEDLKRSSEEQRKSVH